VDGWRLPNTLPVNGSTYNYDYSYDGSTDYGFNMSAPGTIYAGSKGSEMAYLYYNDLGNAAGGPLARGPFTNLPSYFYWSGTEKTSDPDLAWTFVIGDGCQNLDVKVGVNYYALAVHSGDVGAPVPIPGAILLFASGLAGLVAVRRRFKK